MRATLTVRVLEKCSRFRIDSCGELELNFMMVQTL